MVRTGLVIFFLLNPYKFEWTALLQHKPGLAFSRALGMAFFSCCIGLSSWIYWREQRLPARPWHGFVPHNLSSGMCGHYGPERSHFRANSKRIPRCLSSGVFVSG
jgi:hypothetical protein